MSSADTAAAQSAIVALVSLGGTITMTVEGDRPGVQPRLTAADLVAGVPGLAEVARLEVATLQQIPGASLTFADILAAVAWAREQVDRGAAGAVLVQGTDTLEETAYLADLVWDRTSPLVFTGAMRSPGQPSADGPANLLAAVTTAAAPAVRDLGVLVVLNDTIHAAARVRKGHASALDAFTSPNGGPLGQVVEGQTQLWTQPRRVPPLAVPTGTRPARVALVEVTLSDDGELVRTLGQGSWDGLVLAGFGAGHLPAVVAELLPPIVARIPVVVASRTGAGRTLRMTYGFVGSETDLLARGVMLAGALDARKVRVLLWALLSGGADREALSSGLAAHGVR